MPLSWASAQKPNLTNSGISVIQQLYWKRRFEYGTKNTGFLCKDTHEHQ